MESERRKARARAAEAARKRYEEFRKSRIYRTSQFVSAFYDYLFVAIGVIIILSVITGLITKLLAPPDPVTGEKGHIGMDIMSTAILSFIGVVFIIFAGSNVVERRKKRKHRKQAAAKNTE